MGKTNSDLDQRNTKILVQKSKTPWRKCHKNSIHPQLAAPTLLPCQLWPAGVSLSLSQLHLPLLSRSCLQVWFRDTTLSLSFEPWRPQVHNIVLPLMFVWPTHAIRSIYWYLWVDWLPQNMLWHRNVPICKGAWKKVHRNMIIPQATTLNIELFVAISGTAACFRGQHLDTLWLMQRTGVAQHWTHIMFVSLGTFPST